MFGKILYVLACVAVPIGWGLLVYRVSNWMTAAATRRRANAAAKPNDPDAADLTTDLPGQ